jgi:hypothetical protein
MKTMLSVFLTFASLGSAQIPTLKRDGDLYTLTFVSSNPSLAHLSANIFAREVGNVLKTSYPSRVIDPSVNLHVFARTGKKFYQLTWMCRILRADTASADYYFDRRGSLLYGRTLVETEEKVEKELAQSKKVQVLHSSFPRGRIPEDFIRDSFSGSRQDGYWYIKEFFLVAPK